MTVHITSKIEVEVSLEDDTDRLSFDNVLSGLLNKVGQKRMVLDSYEVQKGDYEGNIEAVLTSERSFTEKNHREIFTEMLEEVHSHDFDTIEYETEMERTEVEDEETEE